MQLRTESATDVVPPEWNEELSANQGRGKARPRARPYRLAVLTSHVIQYQDPLFKQLAAERDIDLTVFFCSDWGAAPYRDPGFGREVCWDVQNILEGYRSKVLKNWSLRPKVSRFWGLVNPRIIVELAGGNFDAIWVHGWSNCTTWIAMLTAFVLGIPVLLRGESHLLCPPASTLRQRIKRRVLVWLFRRVAAFLAIGSLNAEFYRAYGAPESRIFQVPYSVDNQKFIQRAMELRSERASIRARLGASGDTPVVLFSGKLIPQKSPLDLLRAFEEAVAKCPAHLVYLGDGRLASELRKYASSRKIPNVHFVGFQNQSKLAEFFVAADLFVLPSRHEPWGLVVNEALCFGLPVILSDRVGAGQDLVDDNQTGFIFPSGDVAALRDCLLRLLSEGPLRKRMSLAAEERIARWSFEADIAGIRASLRAVANGGA